MRIHALIISFIVISLSTAAQTDTSYQLLWYKGKKIKPNVLLTLQGDTVNYNPTKATIKVTSRSGTGKKLDRMLAELGRSNKRADEMMKKLTTVLPSKKLWPAYATQVKKAFESVQRDFTGPLSNTMNIPILPIPGLQAGTGKGGYTRDETDIEKIFDDYVSEIKKYITEHANDNINWVPTPPRFDFSYCYSCDSEKQKQYTRDFEAFRKELAGPDYEILSKALNAGRQAHFLLSGEKYSEIQGEVNRIINFILFRMDKKAHILLDKFIDDPYRVHSVLQIVMSVERTNELMGVDGAIGFGAYNFLVRGASTIANLFEKAVNERDYSIALNINGLLSLERIFQLNDTTTPRDIFEKVLRFNQFKLNVNVSSKLGEARGWSLAELEGDNWFYAIPDSSCRLNWVMVGPLMNKMKMNLLEAEWKGQGGEIPYVGTKDWNSDVPSLKLDFCTDRTDSITFYLFFPQGYKEMWKFPPPWNEKDVSQISGTLFACFLNVERTKEDYAKYKDPANIEKLKKEMAAKYAQMLKNNKAYSIPRQPNQSIDIRSLSEWANLQKQSKEFSELAFSVNPGRILFTPVVHNKDKLIIEDKINGKDLFPNNDAILYAWFHIKLEHDPDGPYPTHLW